jgi:hypothetical protein
VTSLIKKLLSLQLPENSRRKRRDSMNLFRNEAPPKKTLKVGRGGEVLNQLAAKSIYQTA